jgi:hypothetical protein
MTSADIPQLREALDEAIYTLESIKRGAARGAASLNPEWHCADICKTASESLAKLSALLSIRDLYGEPHSANRSGLNLCSASRLNS